MGMHVLQSFIGTWIQNLEARHKMGIHDRMLVSLLGHFDSHLLGEPLQDVCSLEYNNVNIWSSALERFDIIEKS